ncbi:hypothetical protein A2U01_0043359, partial [Trifolium medium]|nr:hypothetical protein [Trifolium medium]
MDLSFPFFVRDFWKHATVIDGGQDGQREIRSSVMGMEVSITQDIVAHVIGALNEGTFEPNSEKIKNSEVRSRILQTLFASEGEGNSANDLCLIHKLLFKVLIKSIVPKEGGETHLSWVQRHLLLMLVEEEQIHLPAYIFNRFCEAVEEGSQKVNCLIQYCKLLSEFFHQAGLIK